jgi:RHS repeat-associated protein
LFQRRADLLPAERSSFGRLRTSLGGAAITLNSAGNRLNSNTELRYFPYSAARYDTLNQQTIHRYTGQRIETSTGLYDYGARWYDPAIGRFLAADTIVPDPGDPQALNRYAYVLNNPVRYTDSTGMFSEDQIMQYLGVGTWDDVLAMFGEGGVMAGAWGFLEVLRQAELGDPISMWYDISGGMTAIAPITGSFYEQNGQLMFGGQIGAGANPLFLPAVVFGQMSNYGRPTAYAVNNGAIHFILNHQHIRLKFDAGRVDWVGVGLDATGIVADILSGGTGGRAINGIQIVDAAASTRYYITRLSLLHTSYSLAVDIQDGEVGVGNWAGAALEWGDFGLDYIGLSVPIFPDAAGLILGITEGFYWTP